MAEETIHEKIARQYIDGLTYRHAVNRQPLSRRVAVWNKLADELYRQRVLAAARASQAKKIEDEVSDVDFSE